MKRTALLKSDDLSEDHLRWLVEKRSENQSVTLDLYILLQNKGAALEENIQLQAVAQELAATAFSLWRSVFLSDLTEELSEQMSDVNKFLGTLISHNAIGYPQDRNAREWTFRYYLKNARYRLTEIADIMPELLPATVLQQPVRSAKENWSQTQAALALAVSNLREFLDGDMENAIK